MTRVGTGQHPGAAAHRAALQPRRPAKRIGHPVGRSLGLDGQSPGHRKWVLTGVVTGPDGVEVWLLHAESGQSRRLIVGQSIQGARLVAAAGVTAEFQVGEERFEVPIGGPLRR